MAPVCRLLAALLIATIASGNLRVQQSHAQVLPSEILSEAAMEAYQRGDTLLERKYVLTRDGSRFDPLNGVLRASRHFERTPEPPADAEAAAALVIQHETDRFGWAESGADLQLVSLSERPRSTHVLYRQVLNGIPVYNRYVRINLDAEGYPTLVVSDYEPRVVRKEREIAREATLTAEDAARIAAEGFTSGTHVRTNSRGLVVFPGDPPRLAWHMIAWPESPGGEWEMLVDALTGDFLHVIETSMRFRNGSGAHRHGPEASFRNHTGNTAAQRVDGTGYVFDPDPLTTADVLYGPPFVNNQDGDSPELDAERRLVVLPSLTLSDDGLYRLDGPHVRIVGENASNRVVYTPPAQAHPDSFRYTRSNDFFEAVNAYYHIDASQRYVQRLGFGDRQNLPLPVNPHGEGRIDQSRYYPHLNFLSFGTGGVDDAEDADVILHEYGHAILEAGTPGLAGSTAGQKIHEGWADYWAASYRRHMVETGEWPDHDWRRLFRWDAGYTGTAGTYWPGRVVNRAGRYPDALTGNRWTDGLLLATTLMEVFDHVGREKSDELNLQAHLYLTAGAAMPEYAHAVIQAEIDLYDGLDAPAIIGVFVDRGFVSRSSFAPMIVHDPARDARDTGSELVFEADVSSYAGTIADVRFHFEIDGTWMSPAAMAVDGGTRYSREIALPEGVDSIAYYFTATDEHGEMSMLPAAAPDTLFRIAISTDVTPPEIRHAPVVRASLDGWPVEIEAVITDASGVDTAWVSFRVREPGSGTIRIEGAFGLAEDAGFYAAPLPLAPEAVHPNDIIEYRLHARDRAIPANEKVLPAADQAAHSFAVASTGTIRHFTFDGPHRGLEAAGQWENGTPSMGVHHPFSGNAVMATRLDSAYASDGSVSSLTLPAVATGGADAFLIFHHWYATAEDESGAVDGGLIRWSADGGASWTPFVLQSPPARAITHDKNPMLGAPAFAGRSMNWRRTVLPLPRVPEVRIRFDFATADYDAQTGHDHAGWIIDHAHITTTVPHHADPPTLSELPPPLITMVPEEEIAPLGVRIAHPEGIDYAWLHYVLVSREGDFVTADSVALEMDAHDSEVYTGSIPVAAGTASVGSRIQYYVEAVDFFGNTARAPDAGSFFLIEYRRESTRNLLANLVRTGLWRQAESGWRAAPEGGSGHLSSLVLAPVEVPANAAEASLRLEHRFNLGPGVGGNVKASVDDGLTWNLLVPEEGYPAEIGLPGNVQPVFAGVQGNAFDAASFDLTPFAGRQVRLRVDFASPRGLEADEQWEIRALRAAFSTADDQFETPRELALHGNFPNPFSDRTTISFTLDAPGFVELSIFDALGREIMQILSEERMEGSHVIPLDGTNLATGLYLLRLNANGQSLVRKITLIR